MSSRQTNSKQIPDMKEISFDIFLHFWWNIDIDAITWFIFQSGTNANIKGTHTVRWVCLLLNLIEEDRYLKSTNRKCEIMFRFMTNIKIISSFNI